MMRSLIAALSAFFVLGCAAATPQREAALSPSDAAGIDAANAAFSAAWVSGDVEGLLDAYTPDAVVHPPAGGVLTSRESIRPVWAAITNWQRVGHRLEPTLRQSLSGGEVLEMGRWHSARRNDAGEAPWVSGCYTVIWRRDAGVWRMKYDAWTNANEASWACRPR